MRKLRGEVSMDEERINEPTEEIPEKKSFIEWVKEHKVQLLFAGVSITTVMATILGFKNKESITELWNSLRKEIEKGSLYSTKWFEKARLDDLYEARKIIHKDYLNTKLDADYRSECWNLLVKIDNAIGKLQWAGKKYGFPAHSENGWHLPDKD